MDIKDIGYVIPYTDPPETEQDKKDNLRFRRYQWESKKAFMPNCFGGVKPFKEVFPEFSSEEDLHNYLNSK